MSAIENKVQFGARLSYALTPKEGFEIESVEVFNQTANQAVPCQLIKTSDNPPQYTCSFVQPAGVVSIRPKMKPILYSVIIEESEFCSVVLVESNGDVDIQITSMSSGNGAAANGSENSSGTEETGTENETKAAQGAAEKPEMGNEAEHEAGNDASRDAGTREEDTSGAEGSGKPANFNEPQHSDENEEHADEAVDVEDENTDIAAESGQDCAYDAGEFEDELKDVEPVFVTRKVHDDRCEAYWQHRKAFNSGQISKEKYEKIKAQHMKFIDDISTGKIIVQEP